MEPQSRYVASRGEKKPLADILAEKDALETASRLIAEGGIAAVPTETVYGLAGDASNGIAVASIFETKGRPGFNPLICHVSDIDMAETLAIFSLQAKKLADAFWPGPLTLVLPKKNDAPVHPLVTAGLDTIALRFPRGFVAKLVKRLGKPVAAPSANSSGRITATSAAAVNTDLGSRIQLIVDGGPCDVGLESTILKVVDDQVELLRPGGISAEEIEQACGIKIKRTGKSGSIQAPGMMKSHYAPNARLRLNAISVEPREALLAFGPDRANGAGEAAAYANLSETGDLREAAANLFALMNVLDRSGAETIAVEPIPDSGLGEAINDRLARAAAPRDS